MDSIAKSIEELNEDKEEHNHPYSINEEKLQSIRHRFQEEAAVLRRVAMLEEHLIKTKLALNQQNIIRD